MTGPVGAARRDPTCPRSGDRAGFVLAMVVVALAGLTLLVHGGLLLARHDVRVARVGEALVQARGLARAGMGVVRDAAEAWPPPGTDPTLADAEAPGGSFRVVRRSLGPEWWLVESRGRAAGGTAEARWVAPVWSLEPATRVAAFTGVVEVAPGAPVQGAGAVAVDGLLRPLAGRSAADCIRHRQALAGVAWSRPGPVATRPELAAPVADPGLGLLSFDTLLARIPVHLSGAGRPGADERGGVCLEGPWAWGDPGRGAGPCASRWVARASPGSLAVDGGAGQGLLVVGGDLTLTRGAHLRGLVLVGGLLSMDEGARLEGLARARGGLRVAGGATVSGSACAAAMAIEAAGLAAPVFGHSGWNVPLVGR